MLQKNGLFSIDIMRHNPPPPSPKNHRLVAKTFSQIMNEEWTNIYDYLHFVSV